MTPHSTNRLAALTPPLARPRSALAGSASHVKGWEADLLERQRRGGAQPVVE